MSGTPGSGAGGDHLARRSDITKLRKDLPPLKDVLIVEDENFDAERLRATLRVIFGYGLEVRRASTLGAAVDCVLAKPPELLLLDDYLKPSDNAVHTIPYLRRAGYQGPIVVISGELDKARRALLLAAGVKDTIHKDALDSVRVAEALVSVFRPEPAAKA